MFKRMRVRARDRKRESEKARDLVILMKLFSISFFVISETLIDRQRHFSDVVAAVEIFSNAFLSAKNVKMNSNFVSFWDLLK